MIQVRRAALRGTLDDASAVAKAGAKEDIRISEEALLERDDDELGAAEACAEERADVLRVREVERSVDLVEDVHRRGLELQQRHDQRERDQRPLASAQLRQTLLPHAPQLHLDLQPVHQVLPVRRLQLGEVPRQQLRKDPAKVPAQRDIIVSFSGLGTAVRMRTR